MNIHCLNKISPVGLKQLPESYKLVKDISLCDAILVRSANMHETSLSTSVLAVARAGAGVNNIPLDKYASQGVIVFNTPGANANAVKELTILGMLLASRDVKGSMKWVDDNKGDEAINKSMEKAKSAFAGTEIYGKTLGIIGCGAIGALVAGASAALGMHVIAVEPNESTRQRNAHLLPSDIEFVSYDELYKRSDYISLHVPLCDGTRGMLNKEAFNKMKQGVIIVNCARDAIVNDDDLEEALKEGKVGKYVTDFPNHKTANMDGVIAISHLGASTIEAEDNCASMAINQLVEYIENGNIINSVNYPSISLGKKNGKRVVILFKGDLIKEVSNLLKGATSLVSGLKGDYGCVIADIEDVDINAINKIEGIIKVRII